jgi:hypothetical protein
LEEHGWQKKNYLISLNSNNVQGLVGINRGVVLLKSNEETLNAGKTEEELLPRM